MNLRTTAGCVVALTGALVCGCGGGDFPSRPTPVASGSVTTVSGGSWSGNAVLGNGAPTSFNMTLIGRGLGSVTSVRRTAAQTPGSVDVSGTFQTGSGLAGTVQGTLQGTFQNGSFDGTLTSSAPACTRSYAGPITESALTWVVRGPASAGCLLPDSVQLGRELGGTCQYVASLTRQSFSGNGGSGEIVVTTGANCTWAPEPLDSWLRVDSTDPRVGSGRVTFTVAANTLAAREGRLRVAGQTLTVAQGAACIYDVSPLSLTVDANGSTTSVTVTTAALCEWTAQSSTSWLSVRPSSGAGSATVAVVAEANPGAERQGTVTVADRTVTVSQAASCNLGLTPTSVTHGPEAQSQSLAVATGPTCAWSASSNASWLLLTNTTGIGPGGVGYSLPVNRGPQRTGNITVSRTGAAATSTVTQLSGCTYTLTGDQGSPPPRFVDITTSDPACRWTLRLSDPWLNVNGPTTFTGSGTTRVPLNVEFDCSKGFRSATVELFGEDGTKRGQVTITQTISCTIILAQG